MPRAEDIGNKIKGYRTEKNMSQQCLADKAGVTVSAIGNYEAGLRIPKDSVKVAIAEALGVGVETLFFESEIHKS